MAAARWISGWLHCGRWLSRGCVTVPDSIKDGTTAKFSNSWRGCFCVWNHTCLWLSVRLAKGVSCSTARVRWLHTLERRWKSHSSKQELSNIAGEVNSLAAWESWLWCQTQTLWKLALVKWGLVPGVGQSWAEETGSGKRRVPLGEMQIRMKFLLIADTWLDSRIFWLDEPCSFFHLKIFYWVEEKLKDKEELMYV